MKPILLLVFIVACPLAGIAESRSFSTKEGKILLDPLFIKLHENKAVIVHNDGVEFLEKTPEVLDFFKINPAESGKAAPFITKDKVENWLIDIEKNARKRPVSKTTTPVPTPVSTPTPTPLVVEAKPQQTSFTATTFSKDYKAEIHDGKSFQISGTITAITGTKAPYTIVLDDAVAFAYNGNERVKARDTLGNPKSIGSYTIGSSASARGVCLGTDANGYISIQGSTYQGPSY